MKAVSLLHSCIRGLACCSLLWVLLLAAPLDARTPSGPRLLHSDDQGALFEFIAPPLALNELNTSQLLELPGAVQDPAAPGLPLFYALVAAPPGATLTLEAATGPVRSLRATPPAASTASQTATIVGPPPNAAPITDDGIRTTNYGLHATDRATGTTPAACTAPARITGDAWLRGQRIVTLGFSPLQRCPNGELRWRPRMQVELRWSNATLAAAPPTLVDDPLSEPALRTTLLNYAQARHWRMAPTPEQNVSPATQRLKISVAHAGLYRLSYADLRAAGLPLDALDPRNFSFSSQGHSVAVLVRGEADGRFDAADELIFYGEPLANTPVQDSVILDGTLVITDTIASRSYAQPTEYSDTNVYWLEWNGSPGPRMAAADATPQSATPAPNSYRASLRLEQSNEWWTWHFTSRDPWLWARLVTSSSISANYPIALSAIDPAGQPAELRGELVARAHNPAVEPDHHTRVVLNGVVAEDATWDGLVRHTVAGQLPISALREGSNQISLTVATQPGTASDDLLLDWFELRYDRLFVAQQDRLDFSYEAPGLWRFEVGGLSAPDLLALDIAAPAAPRLLAGTSVTSDGSSYRASFQAPGAPGARYLVAAAPALERPLAMQLLNPSGLRAATNGADYIFIAHSSLITATQALADYRAAQGLRTAVVDLAALYDEFNHGMYHPVAIKRFLAYAYANWQPPAPQYVLLVGDGHWNFKGRNPARYGAPPPVLMPPNLAWVDPWQGQVDSSNQLAAIVGNDLLPDLAIGRLPARNPGEVAAVLAKIVTHEAAPLDAPWRRRLTFVADNVPDPAGDFPASTEAVIAAAVPADKLEVQRLYLDEYCGPAQNSPQACPAIARAITETVSVSGTLVLNYAGHGGIGLWAKENALYNGLVSELRSAEHPPVVLSMTCLDGFWDYPNNESLAETLIRQPAGGAVATFSPTGLGLTDGHEQLQIGFYNALFAGRAGRLGAATIAARLALFASGEAPDLIDTYTIFGDPALRLAVPAEFVEQPKTPTPNAQPRLYLPLLRR